MRPAFLSRLEPEEPCWAAGRTVLPSRCLPGCPCSDLKVCAGPGPISPTRCIPRATTGGNKTNQLNAVVHDGKMYEILTEYLSFGLKGGKLACDHSEDQSALLLQRPAVVMSNPLPSTLISKGGQILIF